MADKKSAMEAIFEPESRLEKLLLVEAALARAHASLGNIPAADAEEIGRKATTGHVKLSRIREIEAIVKHPIMAMVETLAEACGSSGKYVHLGATSSDIIDTALALEFKEACGIIQKDLVELEKILKELARQDNREVASLAEGFAHDIGRNIERLREGKKRFLLGKMSGAVGTQASFGRKGTKIQDMVMKELGLKRAMVSSQIIQRDRYAELIILLALIAATSARMARDVRGFLQDVSYDVDTTVDDVCSSAGIIMSNVFVALENVSLEHERDLTNYPSEMVILPQSFGLLDEILNSMKSLLNAI